MGVVLRNRSRLTVALFIVSTMGSLAVSPQFHGSARMVAVYATVRDAAGRFVTDLTKDEFQIFEDGRPASVAVFSKSLQPLVVAIMLDTSMSQAGGDLTGAFQRVAEQLRQQYLLGFIPAQADGRTHKLEVRVTKPGLTVNARKSYVAEAVR